MDSTSSHALTWTINGTYATWTMNIRVTPPDEPVSGALPAFPRAQFSNLTRYFADSVNLYEATRHGDHQVRVHGVDEPT